MKFQELRIGHKINIYYDPDDQKGPRVFKSEIKDIVPMPIRKEDGTVYDHSYLKVLLVKTEERVSNDPKSLFDGFGLMVPQTLGPSQSMDHILSWQ